MRGREIFAKVEPLLNFGVRILHLFPRGLVESTWWMVEALPGVLGHGIRYMYAKRLCKSCGRNVKIDRRADIRHWENLSIGNNVAIHEMAYIDARGGIEIKDDCSIGFSSATLSFDHTFWTDPNVKFRDAPLILKPISIGPDAGTGFGVCVLGGVTISQRIMVGANAVVTKDLLEPGIYAGIPAKKIKSVELPPEMIASPSLAGVALLAR
jgi:acetyltransferase-like isoleucine patch superfamily enzyme